MFEQSVTDLVRGIRVNKKNEVQYIQKSIGEIRCEIVSSDLEMKARAISKLTVLHTMGYSMEWAAFHVVELMSGSSIVQKRIGYHAAALSFQQDTQVLLLSTNCFLKDLTSNDVRSGAIALHALAQIVDAPLARATSENLFLLLNHSNQNIRKRTIVTLYRVFLKHPEALRLCFNRIKEKLNENESSVVSTAISVICELARKNPKNYLKLAPQLYKLLSTSGHNWMLIKIVKLFASLTPLEPRLSKKLIPVLLDIIVKTRAMSLMYECIQTVIDGQMIPLLNTPEASTPLNLRLVSECTDKLVLLINDDDQNLKYLGLCLMCKLVKVRPKAVDE
jgi:AP-3 complex subunit delta-1